MVLDRDGRAIGQAIGRLATGKNQLPWLSVHSARIIFLNGATIMSKAQDSKKAVKKEPAKSPKEKKEAKKVKKEASKRQ